MEAKQTMNNQEIKIEKWPVYKDSMLVIGNPESQVAICSLWTKKELVSEKLNLGKIAVIGNLYSPRKGISFLIRNILANPRIRYLVVCGLDNSGSGQVLVDLFKNGFEKIQDSESDKYYWRIVSDIENRIDIEIEEEAVKSFRQGVELIDLRKESDYAKIQEVIDSLDQNLPPFAAKPLVFPAPPKEEVNIFPSEPTAHIVRGEKIAEVWLRILNEILRFGITDKTSYQNRQKEIIDLVSVISDEDPNNLYIPDWLPNNEEHLKNYLPTILTGICPAGSSYTYGSRMRSYFGVDQVQKVIDEIKKEKYTRRAVINLLDPKVDSGSKNPPCLNHCWFRVQDDKLYLVATLRSNDMFEAWPENAFGLRMLQDLVYKEIVKTYPEIKLGDLVMHSLSAHIYDDAWEDAKQVIEKHYNRVVPHPRNVRDFRGNFIIKVENKEIVVEHYSPDEILLNTYKGKTAMPIYLRMSRDGAVSVVSHALYLGTELQKAETAIKFGFEYTQDQELKKAD
jgi:thymidylate synthase